MPNTDWSVAGLCVTVRPDDLDAVEAQLRACPGLEVHARDDVSGRLVVVQECRTDSDHRQSLEKVQALPGVLTADLVVHYSDPECGSGARTTGGES
jgi:nitrate reductase NapAB chaperone NapD